MKSFLEFLAAYPSKYHVIEGFRRMLVEAGYSELCLKREWEIKPGGRYFTTRGGSSLIAFVAGNDPQNKGYRLIAAHSDTPVLRLKPQPDMRAGRTMVKFNTEIYGGAILYTWFDRPLSLAGRVTLETEDVMHPKNVLFDMRKAVGLVPSVAIHLNRGVNDSFVVNKQVDMSVLMPSLGAGDMATFERYLAKELGVSEEAIVDYDLNFYDVTPGQVVGLDEANGVLVASRLDDIMMAYPAVRAMCDIPDEALADGAGRMVCIFDNEEVGSSSKQGACSPLLTNVFERLSEKYGYTSEAHQRMLYNSFVISADMAHGLHPNHPEKSDPMVQPELNGGIVVKVNSNQKYMTDGNSSVIARSLCKRAGVPCQMFVNRSDSPGGSTLGNMLTSQIDIHGVDIGCAMLGMHSLRETAGVRDYDYLVRLFDTYYSSKY